MLTKGVNYGEEVMSRDENMEKALEARTSILKVLSDGQWHQTKDLKVETKVSSRTLYKHLKELEVFIERREEKESGFPKPPVYYRASPTLLSLIGESLIIEGTTKGIMADLLNTKDLSSVLWVINEFSNGKILSILSAIKKQSREVTDPELTFLLRSFVWKSYEYLTLGLVKTSMKIIDDLDLEQVSKELRKE
jgi:hypothetical protein